MPVERLNYTRISVNGVQPLTVARLKVMSAATGYTQAHIIDLAIELLSSYAQQAEQLDQSGMREQLQRAYRHAATNVS